MNWTQHKALMESEQITDRTEFCVLNALAFFADKYSAECWPGIAEIAKKARLAVAPDGKSRATEGALKSLLEAGHISIVSKGGGRFKTTTYRVHIGGKKEAETPQEMRGNEGGENPAFNDRNPAGNAGVVDSETPHLTTETPHMDTDSQKKPRISIHSLYKAEVANKRNEVVNEGDVYARGAPAPTSENGAEIASPNLSENPTSNDADFVALQEVTGWMHGTRSREHNGQLIQSMIHLRKVTSPPPTPENIRLFGQKWRATGKSRPFPGQVVTSWEDIFNPPIRENQNGTHQHFSSGPAANTYLTPRQRARAELDLVLEQQGLK